MKVSIRFNNRLLELHTVFVDKQLEIIVKLNLILEYKNILLYLSIFLKSIEIMEQTIKISSLKK